MIIHSLQRDKKGRFLKVKPKSKPKSSKLTKVFISPTKDEISPKVKAYINQRIKQQNEFMIECLQIFIMDMESSLERDHLDWED